MLAKLIPLQLDLPSIHFFFTVVIFTVFKTLEICSLLSFQWNLTYALYYIFAI